MAEAIGFPRELLERPWAERLEYFRAFTLAHPLLLEIKDQLMATISESEPNSLVFVFGPTGVGKTTLRMKVEQIITNELRSELEQDSGRIPVVGVAAIAPESGRFCWSEHFRRLLLAMNEPLSECKRDAETLYIRQRSTFGSKSTIAEYRHAVEQALRFRRPAAVMIDEAQHLSKMASGRRLLDQLDVIKSIANDTLTVHVLFGTYDLLASVYEIFGPATGRQAEARPSRLARGGRNPLPVRLSVGIPRSVHRVARLSAVSRNVYTKLPESV